MYTNLFNTTPYLLDALLTFPEEFNLTQEQHAFFIHHYKMTSVLSELKMTFVLSDINSGLGEHLWRMRSLLREIPYGSARAFGAFWRVGHYWVPSGWEVQSQNDHFRYSSEYLSSLTKGEIYKPKYVETYAYQPDHVIPSGRQDQVTQMVIALEQAQFEQMGRNAAAIVNHLEL